MTQAVRQSESLPRGRQHPSQPDGEGRDRIATQRPLRTRGTGFTARWRPRSLRSLLLVLLLPGVLVSLIIDSYNDHQTLVDITKEAYDHALRPAVRALENSIYTDATGNLRFDPPWYAFEDLESIPEEQVYFRAQLLQANPAEVGASALANSILLAGTSLLPLPTDWERVADPAISFYDSHYAGSPVRVAAQLREITVDGETHYLLVQVAQSQDNRLHAETVAWRQEIRRDVRAVIVVAILLWLGIRWGLKPLDLLRREVASRRADDTAPLDVSGVPQEVVPLVEAVNYHIARHRRMLEQQSQFLADASHQLRTPLAVMRTQAEYALREPDRERARESLRALVERLEDTRRMTDQLLSLARAQHAPAVRPAPFDLAECGRSVLISALALAESRSIDLGWQDQPTTSGPVIALGRRDGIQQALINLVDNALRYTPAGGTVTLDAGIANGTAWISVTDNGPGIPSDQRQQALKRFGRLRSSPSGTGAGLGLAIAQAFVERDGGTLELTDGLPNAQGGHGLTVALRLPIPESHSSLPTISHS